MPWLIDCHEPVDMIALEKNMREHSENIMGWRHWHHNREVDEEDTYDNIICGQWYQHLHYHMIKKHSMEIHSCPIIRM